jgi:hypothetical protein
LNQRNRMLDEIGATAVGSIGDTLTNRFSLSCGEIILSICFSPQSLQMMKTRSC